MKPRPTIKRKQGTPYGGEYVLNLPERGLVGRAGMFDNLVTNVAAYRKANGIPMGLGFEDEVEAAVCEEYPNECEDIDPTMPRKRTLSMWDVLHGTKVMLKHKLAGSPLVSQEEANRRAEICSHCRYNVTFRLPCGGLCGELKSLVESVVGGKGTPYDKSLRSCGICGCFLTASVWVPLDIQAVGLTEEQKLQFANIPHCWKQT